MKVMRYFCMILVFMMYSITHGACSFFETEVSRCEMVSAKKIDCHNGSEKSNSKASQSPDSNAHSESLPDQLHLCSCVGLFAPQQVLLTFWLPKENLYLSFRSNHYNGDFSQRIERPPIS